MQESEAYIQTVHNQSLSAQEPVCEQLFDNPKTYGQWEASHFQLMTSVADPQRTDAETLRLRQACFALTHRKALFEYLKENKVVGAERVAIFSSLFGPVDYTNAVVTEHGRFLRSTWSLLCADHLETALLYDHTFVVELAEYRTAYADYFSLYCGRIVAAVRGEDYALDPLIAYMKRQAADIRRRMIALPLHRPQQISVNPDAGRATSGPRPRPARPYYYSPSFPS